MTTTVINKHHHREWLTQQEDHIYIGRPSKWGNPFVIGKDGDRAEVVAKYEAWLAKQVTTGEITLDELAELSGKTLVCFCKPYPCHGDVLAKYADMAKRELDS